MTVAILGATSQIAKDLIINMVRNTDLQCLLFSRCEKQVKNWLENNRIAQSRCQSYDYESFNTKENYSVIINFVGGGDPQKIKNMGSDILDITNQYDTLATDYIKKNPQTKYIFLSSGAVYGGNFVEPASHETQSRININNLDPTDYYGIAKIYAEVRHRAMSEYMIVDIRVFNYFSRTHDMSSKFFMTDLIGAIKNKEKLLTTPVNIVRDFVTPDDFFYLIQEIIRQGFLNAALDCYTKAPIDKLTLISEMHNKYGLEYEVTAKKNIVNGTGEKINYYSNNKVTEVLAYSPRHTSLSGIIKELDFMLDSEKNAKSR
jgi:nucleoside-diphosphate-sugar epimerase